MDILGALCTQYIHYMNYKMTDLHANDGVDEEEHGYG
jgi:hypothetical protein